MKPQEPHTDASTYLATERTVLAWIRTGLALMGFGFVVARFGLFLRQVQLAAHLGTPHTGNLSLYAGTGLVLLGVVVNILSTVRYHRNIRRLNRGEMTLTAPSQLAIWTSILLAALGVFIIFYLLYFR